MQFIIDSADTKAIRHCMEFFPVAGVTTNPTIISREKSDFKQLIAEIRSIIGPDKMLHVQCTSDTAEEIVAEAQALKTIAGGDFYVKITEDNRRRRFLCKNPCICRRSESYQNFEGSGH